jgi:hypothetical protein
VVQKSIDLNLNLPSIIPPAVDIDTNSMHDLDCGLSASLSSGSIPFGFAEPPNTTEKIQQPCPLQLPVERNQ